MFHWYTQFPNENAIEKCLKPLSGPDVAKINVRRFTSAFWQALLWASVALLGQVTTGDGLSFALTVNFFSRTGWAIAWMFFSNINHSLAWNQYLAEGKDRQNWVADYVFIVLLGGKARVNELKFHDLHHAFPNKVGAMSMRGRFFGADKVYDGAMRLLEHGLYEVVADGAPCGMAMKMQASVMQQKKMDEGGKVEVTAADTDRKLVKAQDPLINKLQRQRSYMYRKKA